MKKYFRMAMAAGVLALALSACNGNSEHDGFKSLEGSADPANDGGKLGGEHAATPADTMKHDTVHR